MPFTVIYYHLLRVITSRHLFHVIYSKKALINDEATT
jgi:hypothetical protein